MSTSMEGTPGPSGPEGGQGAARRRPSARTVVAAAAMVAALVAAVVVVRTVGAEGPPPPEPVAATAPFPASPPAAPSPAPTPETLPTASSDAVALLAEEYGITDVISAGISVEDDGLELITGIFEPGYDFLADEGDWRAWTRRLRTRPTDVPGFAESAVVLLDPRRPCVDFHRQVTTISSGVGGAAGARIEAALLEATGPRPFPYVGADEVAGSFPHCLDPAKDEWWGTGYVLDEVLAVPCALPSRDVRCFVVTRWFYPQTARNDWVAEVHVFDATTGDRLEGEALHPGMAAGRLERLAGAVLHVAADVPLDRGEPAPAAGFSVVPSALGARVLWLDSARWQSPLGLEGRWVVIPWAVVAAG